MANRCCLRQLNAVDSIRELEQRVTTDCGCRACWERENGLWRRYEKGKCDDNSLPNIIFSGDIPELLKVNTVNIGEYVKSLKERGHIEDPNELLPILF